MINLLQHLVPNESMSPQVFLYHRFCMRIYFVFIFSMGTLFEMSVLKKYFSVVFPVKGVTSSNIKLQLWNLHPKLPDKLIVEALSKYFEKIGPIEKTSGFSLPYPQRIELTVHRKNTENILHGTIIIPYEDENLETFLSFDPRACLRCLSTDHYTDGCLHLMHLKSTNHEVHLLSRELKSCNIDAACQSSEQPIL